MRIARHAGLVLWIAGLLLMGYALYDVAGGKIYQAWRGRMVDRTLDNKLASLPPQPAPHRISYEPGSAIGRLEIPRIGLSVVVLEGSNTGELRLGVGRLRNSAVPGDPGNVVLAGHRDTFFRPLHDIRPGDRISLRTPQGTFPYTVEWTSVVNADDTKVILPTPSPVLTLVTCYPFTYIGSAPQRFIVRATPEAAMATETPEPPPSRPSPFAPPPSHAVRRAVAKAAPPPVAQPADPPAEPDPPPPPSRPSPPAPAAVPAPQPAVAQVTAPPITPPDGPPAAPDPPAPHRKGPIKRALHKLAGVFSTHRAKLQ